MRRCMRPHLQLRLTIEPLRPVGFELRYLVLESADLGDDAVQVERFIFCGATRHRTICCHTADPGLHGGHSGMRVAVHGVFVAAQASLVRRYGATIAGGPRRLHGVCFAARVFQPGLAGGAMLGRAGPRSI